MTINSSDQRKLSDTQIDIIAGICAGIVSQIVSHPLDTIKVRFQIEKQTLRLSHIIADIYAREGVQGFLKGMMSPLLGRTPVAASLFFAQGYSCRQLTERAPSLNSVYRNFLSGVFSGFIYLNVSFPFDFLKILMQSKIGQKDVTYWGEIKSIYNREGLYGYTRGYSGQMLRDIPGFALYFGLFELIKVKLKVSDQDRM